MAVVSVPTFHPVYGVEEAELCNRALIRISASPITDTDTDDSVSARLCKSIYAQARNELLRYIAPSFAAKTAYAQIDSEYSGPMDGYSSAYDVSSFNMLKLLKVSAKEDAVYELLGNGLDQRLLTDEANAYDEDSFLSIEIKYVSLVEDPSLFDDLFVEALVLKVAYKCAVGIVQNPTLLQILKQEADQAAYIAKIASKTESQNNPNDTRWTDRE